MLQGQFTRDHQKEVCLLDLALHEKTLVGAVMTNDQIAGHLDDIAELYFMQEDESKGFAFSKAASSIRSFGPAIVNTKLVSGTCRYVGPSTILVIAEFIRTGSSERYQKLAKDLGLPPESLKELTKITGVGPVTAIRLWKDHGILNFKMLEEAIASGKITDAKLLKAVEVLKTQAARIPLKEALEIAEPLVAKLKTLKKAISEHEGTVFNKYLVQKIEYAGSLRRKKATVKDVDILVATESDWDRNLLRENIKATWPDDILADGESRTRLRINGRQVDIIYTELKHYGAALNYLTGSADFNVYLRQEAKKRGWKVSEYGLFDAKTELLIDPLKEEKDLFDRLEIFYIPPEKRESTHLLTLAIALKDLRQVPGMTFDKAKYLREQFGITYMRELEELVRVGKVPKDFLEDASS